MSNVLDLSWNILMLQRRKRTILVLQGISISFPTWRIGAVLYSGRAGLYLSMFRITSFTGCSCYVMLSPVVMARYETLYSLR